MSDVKKEAIARKNDEFRRTFSGGKVMLTAGVQNDANLDRIIEAVKNFNDFNEDNDPYFEHDCASFDVGGEKFMFKIDYYDDNYEYFKEDGNRVLTIMCADEY